MANHNIDEKSLLNMLRHAWLIGINAHDDFHKASHVDAAPADIDAVINERDEDLKSIIDEQVDNGYTCYNHYCGENCDYEEASQ